MSDQDHWSSPNGCHPDCPACAAEETAEGDPCPHCGSLKDPWFSRSMPMGYYCQDCGKEHAQPEGDDAWNTEPPLLPGFTPGPWVVAHGRYVRPASNAWMTVAQPYDGRDGIALGKEEQAANAQLISAAPELLEVTVTMLRAFEYLAGPEANKDPVIVAARAAVAKAYGQNVTCPPTGEPEKEVEK